MEAAVKNAVLGAKLECAGAFVQFLLAQRTGAGGMAGPSGVETPGSGPSMPTPVPNPFAALFDVRTQE